MKRAIYIIVFCLLTTALFSQPQLNWQRGFSDPLAEGGYTSIPAVDDEGIVYVILGAPLSSSRIQSFYPDGTRKYMYGGGCDISALGDIVPVLGPDNSLYVNSGNGEFYAFNPDGSLKWKDVAIRAYCTKAAVGNDGSVFFAAGSLGGELYAYSSDGHLRWKRSSGTFRTPPIIGPGEILYIACGDTLFALQMDGSVRWKLSHAFAGTLAIDEHSNLFAVDMDSCLYSINEQGVVNWKTRLEEYALSPVIAADGDIFLTSFWGTLFCFSPSGELKWKDATDYLGWTAPTLGSDDAIYVSWVGHRTEERTALMSYSGAGQIKWLLPIGHSIPQLATNNNLYVCVRSLYAYRVSSVGLAKGNWPAIYHDAANSSNFTCENDGGETTYEPAGVVVSRQNIVCYPNPFRSETSISFTVEQESNFFIDIYDLRGVWQTTIATKTLARGLQSIKWKASDFPAGIYVMVIRGKDKIGKCILLK